MFSCVNISLYSGSTLLSGPQNGIFGQYRKLSSLRNPNLRISKIINPQNQNQGRDSIDIPQLRAQHNRPAVGEKFANKGADRHGGVHGGYLGREDNQGRHRVAVLSVGGERPLICWH